MILFVLVDTNVILDFAMKRGEHYAHARELMKEIAEGRLIAHVSASQITDIYYFLEKKFAHEEAVRVLVVLLESIRVIRVDEDTIRNGNPIENEGLRGCRPSRCGAGFRH